MLCYQSVYQSVVDSKIQKFFSSFLILYVFFFFFFFLNLIFGKKRRGVVHVQYIQCIHIYIYIIGCTVQHNTIQFINEDKKALPTCSMYVLLCCNNKEWSIMLVWLVTFALSPKT